MEVAYTPLITIQQKLLPLKVF